jgi:hypothetical protein
MNKLKLIQIIEKELEELKILSGEIAESEEKTSLIIDLALSKARLLCQEIELLRQLTTKSVENPIDDSPEENEEEQMDEDEVSDVSISDPELEIVEFEESEDTEDEETSFDEEEESTDDDLIDDEEELDENEPEFVEEEIDEEDLIEFGTNNKDEIEEDDEEEPQTTTIIESTELKSDFQAGVREITIDMDDDDDDLEPIKVSAASGTVERPVMREIPKPEELIQEKPFVGESFQKERSLNDSIGEIKSTEPPISVGSISSLRASIGLNDRFLFIREIFGNNTDKYNTIIDQLDKLETQQQAVELLKANISLQKNDTSMKFVDLLKRRFSK